ncbi:MAG: hypothetical protein M3Y77_15185 [Actinomycetota bacterium]|nr:hypothetical protein [Actinomycetota bacterium]
MGRAADDPTALETETLEPAAELAPLDPAALDTAPLGPAALDPAALEAAGGADGPLELAELPLLPQAARPSRPTTSTGAM